VTPLKIETNKQKEEKRKKDAYVKKMGREVCKKSQTLLNTT
jgi:hypothetical protein